MKKNFWFITLCVFLIIALFTGLNLPLRIAIAANALIIILNIISQIRGYLLAGRKEKNG